MKSASEIRRDRTCSGWFLRVERESAGELSPTCIFPSFACDFLAGDSSFGCCSLDPLTGSYLPCRRSPRLLTNGYYIWTEDSFLCDRDGNITLSPSQTSVMYKENSVRAILRMVSWLRGSIFGDADSSPGEAIWLEGASRLDAHPCSDSGDVPHIKVFPRIPLVACFGFFDFRSENIQYSPKRPPPRDPAARGTAAEHLQGGILDHSKTSLLGEISFQTVLLAACLAIVLLMQVAPGGLLAGVFACSLTVTIAFPLRWLYPLHLSHAGRHRLQLQATPASAPAGALGVQAVKGKI
ncbi:hypothetical protein QTO34_007557 [Cnephaeus nilssonii]|uniref:Transmembrane protein 71 n=1 Tax=Cnephaeus nilssonii TaxID=3371016 RepID=A0AA40HJM1_CNENI|nr:hypothetical protein QTO34_007557 [Eptesicus nilssonii]